MFMKSTYTSILTFALLATISVIANDQQDKQIYLSAVEVQEMFDNPTRSYVYVGRDVSNLADVIAEISKLEEDENSPVRALEEHIKKGFVIGNYEGVALALEHAEAVLNRIEPDRTSDLSRALNAIVEQVAAEQLNIDATILEAAHVEAPETRACGSCNSHCLRKLVIKEKADFLNDVRFRKDVRIDGSLSVADQVIGCDLTVGCNINMNNSTSAAVGNILKGGNPFLHNFGTNNTFVGQSAGNFVAAGSDNVGIGANALVANTDDQLVAVGSGALQNFVNGAGSQSVAVGYHALNSNVSGNSNTAIGWTALELDVTTTLGNNTALGWAALSVNTTGTDNTAIGNDTMTSNTEGINNIALGSHALNLNTTGNNNIALGVFALSNCSIGGNNIAIGSNAGITLDTGSNNIYIGADAAAVGESNVTRIGGIRGATTGVADAIAVVIDSTGQLGTISSSKAVKHNIQDMNDVSANIYNLNPVTFVYNSDASETTQYGLIAEEVADVFPGIVVRSANGQPETVQYHVLPVLLLNEFKKLAARVAVLEARA
jgi:hypothetical protein